MLIRPATTQQVGEIAELWLDLVAYHHDIDTSLPVPAADGDEQYALLLHRVLRTGRGAVYVALGDHGAILGYALGTTTNLVPDLFEPVHGGLIVDVYVRPESRRQGIGRALVDVLLDWFAFQGVDQVEWDVAAQNEAGRAFWYALGGRDTMVRMHLHLDRSGAQRPV